MPRAAAQLDDAPRRDANRIEVLEKAPLDLALQHRAGVGCRRGTLERAPYVPLHRKDVRRHAARRSTKAATSAWTSTRVCAALSETRKREVPSATVGGRMAGTRNPR